jgi:glycosyltransferase involved in cell wall biosynthesis
MRIVQIITELRPAGAERIVLELSLGVKARGNHLEVVSLMPLPDRSPIVSELRGADIPIHTLNLGKQTPWRIIPLRSLLNRIGPDIVHAHLFHANIASRLGGRRRSYKLVNSVHVAERRRGRGWQFLIDRATKGLFDSQTAVSKAVQIFHARRIGVEPKTMPVIYNGIRQQTQLTPSEIGDLRRKWGLEGCSRVMGSVGRLVKQKGYDILLGMSTTIAENVPSGEKWGLVIIGDGPQASQLEHLAARAPENLRVHLAGFREDAARCVGAFDLFLMPSRFEGFGLTLVEAMAQGTPVLTSDVDSLPEIATQYPHGQVIDFSLKNQERIADAISRALKKPPERHPVHLFTTDKMVEGYLGLYHSLGGTSIPRPTD